MEIALSLVRTILRQFWKYKLLSGIFLLSLLIEVAYAVAAPYSLKFLVDEAFTPKNMDAFLLILGLLLAGGTISIIAAVFGDYSLGKLGGETIRTMRTDLFAHLQKQSLPFFQRYRIGDLLTRFSADMSSIEGVIRGTSPYFIRAALSVLLGLYMLFLLEWKLTLAVLAGSSLMFLGPKLMQRRAEHDNKNFKAAQERFSNTVDEMIKGHKTIKGLHQQERMFKLGRRNISDLFAFGFKLHMTNALMERLPLTALLVLNGTMIGFGGYLIFLDEMTIGEFIAFFTLFMSVGQAAANLSILIPDLIESSVSFSRVEEVLRQKPTVPEAPNASELPASVSSIQFRDVTFGYNEGSNQLRNVSLDIAAGSYTAFVGASGSGKSTALQLLARFYDPGSGAIAFDDMDLRDVSEASLRNYATLVAQDTFLFNTTIRDNLLLDQTHLSDDDMRNAAMKARIHDIIESWPSGYDTEVHHEGGTLSGGERQRLSIARALLRNPEMLLLDEATAALDPGTEADINELLGQLRGRHTIVSVTHRLASVIDADRIFVFHEGQIAESGTHRELLQRSGLYANLWDKQNGFHLSEDGHSATVDAGRLAKLAFFDGINPELLEDITKLFATETCREGDAVVREGDEGDKFYIIVRGKLEVLKKLTNSEGGISQQRVAVLQDGDHFGEIALLRNIPRTATVKALGSAVLLTMRREALNQLAANYPQIRSTLERSLQARV